MHNIQNEMKAKTACLLLGSLVAGKLLMNRLYDYNNYLFIHLLPLEMQLKHVLKSSNNFFLKFNVFL